MQEYVHLHHIGEYLVQEPMTFREARKRSCVCTECKEFLPDTKAYDLALFERPKAYPLAWTENSSTTLIHVGFLEQIDESITSRYLTFGKLTGSDNKPIKDWVTWRGKHQLQIRSTLGKGYSGPGAKYNGYRYCVTCGRLLYTALGKPFLNPAPSPEVELFQSELGGLIMSAELFDTIDLPKKRRRVGVQRVPVLDPPPDGFGDLAPPGWSHPDRHKKRSLFHRFPFG